MSKILFLSLNVMNKLLEPEFLSMIPDNIPIKREAKRYRKTKELSQLEITEKV